MAESTANAGDAVSSAQQGVEYVVNRAGTKERVDVDKIRNRIWDAWTTPTPLSPDIDVELIVKITFMGLYNNIRTSDIDAISISAAANMTTDDPGYGVLAGRIEISNLHKETSPSFSKTTQAHYHCWNSRLREEVPQVSEQAYRLVMNHAGYFDGVVKHDRDFMFDYLGFKTLERSYLKKIGDKIFDRPQYMYMRVAIQINMVSILGGSFAEFEESYEYMSTGKVIHGTPTLVNALAPTPQLASCFLLQNQDDSIEGLFNTFQQCAHISKYSGGIGIAYQNIRGSESFVRGTNGVSHGPISYMRILNDIARAVDQGGKRKGAFAVYMEMWAPDIFDFLNLRKTGGDDNMRCRDLFRALWIDDLFFERLERNEDWSLFSPNEAPGLQKVWGAEFVALYTKYERTPGLARKTVRAIELFEAIYDSVIESGGPYLMSKDACNRYSNQQHLGTIQCSNLCTEVVQYADEHEISVCFLSSIGCPRFVREDRTFDFEDFRRACAVATRHLDLIIDQNSFPDTGKEAPRIVFPREVLESRDVDVLRAALKGAMDCGTPGNNKYIAHPNKAETSSRRHRSIGLGENGVADMFHLMGLDFDSDDASRLLKRLAEHRYFACVRQSVAMAAEKGTYESYRGSPASLGKLSYHLWGVRPDTAGELDWEALEADQLRHGMRNSLLVAPMPTKATSHILGNNECFEPFHSNIFKTRVLAGEFFVFNKHLARELKSRNLWTREIRDSLVANRGSVRDIPQVPDDVKSRFKTAYEISMKRIIDNAAACAPFVDQSRSMNLWLHDPSLPKFTAMILYAWKKHLKTLMYYGHTKLEAEPFSFVANQDMTMKRDSDKSEQREAAAAAAGDAAGPCSDVQQTDAAAACRRDNPNSCDNCGS